MMMTTMTRMRRESASLLCKIQTTPTTTKTHYTSSSSLTLFSRLLSSSNTTITTNTVRRRGGGGGGGGQPRRQISTQQSAKVSSSSTKQPSAAVAPASLKPYQPPPTYKEQIAAGVPFGKRILSGKEHQTAWQMSIGLSVFLAFVLTPYLGKRMARDPEFRAKIPGWYADSYRIEYPRPSKSREERHLELVAMQKELHERAIRGDFTEENLRKMQFLKPQNGQDDDPNGWGRIHPGEDLDDDEDEEEE